MNALALMFMLMLNFGISFWNAYASGAYLTESKIVGGWSRFMVWSGLIMSACGFTWVYTTLMTMMAIASGKLTPEWGEVALKLGYLIIILPVLGSGFAIWVNSIVQAARRRTLGSVAVAGWNTYAQARNTWEAASNAPNFLSDVIEAFSGKGKRRSSSKNDGAAAILVVLIVIIAVFGGAITTGLIARWADRRVALDVVAET